MHFRKQKTFLSRTELSSETKSRTLFVSGDSAKLAFLDSREAVLNGDLVGVASTTLARGTAVRLHGLLSSNLYVGQSSEETPVFSLILKQGLAPYVNTSIPSLPYTSSVKIISQETNSFSLVEWKDEDRVFSDSGVVTSKVFANAIVCQEGKPDQTITQECTVSEWARIKMTGDKDVQITTDDTYVDAGAEKPEDYVSSQLTVDNQVTEGVEGTYPVIYTLENVTGILDRQIRKVVIVSS